jgi:group I intron endonuclease
MSRTYEINEPMGGWPPEGQGCVYLVTNLVNSKQYVGVSINLRKRWHAHCAGNKKTKSYIKNAIHDYGYENFSISILMIGTKEECLLAENGFINQYNTLVPDGYNLCGGGYGPVATISGERHHCYKKPMSEEQKKKISAKLKGRKLPFEHVENMKRGLKNVVRTSEWCEKIRIANKNKTVSQSTRKKISFSLSQRIPTSEYRKKRSDILKKKWENPEFRNMILNARKAAKEQRLETAL